jgi:hypothetical protein
VCFCLQTDLLKLKGRIEKKSPYLQELQDQVIKDMTLPVFSLVISNEVYEMFLLLVNRIV